MDKSSSDDVEKNDDEEDCDEGICESDWYGEDKAVSDIALPNRIKPSPHIVTSPHRSVFKIPRYHLDIKLFRRFPVLQEEHVAAITDALGIL